MEATIKDLDHLEAMLEGIQDTQLKSRFSELVVSVYMEIYDGLTEEERTEVDTTLHIHEMEMSGWNIDTEFSLDGWTSLVYQHESWGHWRVEFHGPTGWIPDWDYGTNDEADAKGWAESWLVSRRRLWN